jgi:hypothetical protein
MWKWMVSVLVCRGNHQCMMHFLGEEKRWECSRCGRFFPIPKSLTGASDSCTRAGKARAREISPGKRGKRAKDQDENQFKTRKKGA